MNSVFTGKQVSEAEFGGFNYLLTFVISEKRKKLYLKFLEVLAYPTFKNVQPPGLSGV